MFLKVVTHRESIAPEVVRTLQILSAHVQGFHTPEIVSRAGSLFHGGILPFAFHDVIACVLRVIVLCMCKCMLMNPAARPAVSTRPLHGEHAASNTPGRAPHSAVVCPSEGSDTSWQD